MLGYRLQQIEGGGERSVGDDAFGQSGRCRLSRTCFGKAELFQMVQKTLHLLLHHARTVRACARQVVLVRHVSQAPAQAGMRPRLGTGQSVVFKLAQ